MKKAITGVSARRRQLLIAAAAGTAVPLSGPGVAGAGSLHVGEAADAANSAELILSGRVLRSDGLPLAGAQVELSSGTLVQTDGDGRFFSKTRIGVTGAGRPAPVQYRVRHDDRAGQLAEVRFTPGAAAEGRATAHRDETGAWRAAVGIRVA